MKQISFYVNTSLKYIITFIIDKQSFSVSGAIFFWKKFVQSVAWKKKVRTFAPAIENDTVAKQEKFFERF